MLEGGVKRATGCSVGDFTRRTQRHKEHEGFLGFTAETQRSQRFIEIMMLLMLCSGEGMASPCPYVWWCPDDRNWFLVGFLFYEERVPDGAAPGGIDLRRDTLVYRVMRDA